LNIISNDNVKYVHACVRTACVQAFVCVYLHVYAYKPSAIIIPHNCVQDLPGSSNNDPLDMALEGVVLKILPYTHVRPNRFSPVVIHEPMPVHTNMYWFLSVFVMSCYIFYESGFDKTR